MYTLINALLLALLIPVMQTQAVASARPTCEAQAAGSEFVTRVELPTGIVVAGPWHVLQTDAEVAGAHRVVVHAELDRLVRVDALTGRQDVIAFDAPVRVAFEGRTSTDALKAVAQTWCATVVEAHEAQARAGGRQMHPTRITAAAPTTRPLL